MSLENVLNELTEKVNKKLKCDGCSFFLRQFTYNGGTTESEIFPAQLFVLKESTSLRHRIGIDMFDCNSLNSNRGIARHAVYTRRIIIVSDLKDDPIWEKDSILEISQDNIGSALAVPVIINNNVEGVIRAIRSKNKPYFSQEDGQRLIGIISVYEDKIADAISNGEFVSIGSTLILDDCCSRAVNMLQKLTKSKGCSIFLLDKNPSSNGYSRYECVNTTGLYSNDNKRIDNFCYEIDFNSKECSSLTEFALKKKCNVFIDDLYDRQELEEYREQGLKRSEGHGKACEYKPSDPGDPAGSIIYSPILLNKDDKPEGIIRVVKSRNGMPTNQRNKNLYSVIDKVNFISLVGILSQTFKNIKYLELLDEIASSTTKKEACQTTVNNISKLIDCKGASIFLYKPNSRLVFEATFGVLEGKKALPHYQLGEGWTGWVGKYQRTLLINDRTEIDSKYGKDAEIPPPRHSERFNECEIGGATADKFLCVPILRSYKENDHNDTNNLIGIIRVPRNKEQFNFTKNDEQLLKAIAKGLGQRILHFEYNKQFNEHKFLIGQLGIIDTKSPLFTTEESNEIMFRYLTFLTHKEGLGINRAFYLNPGSPNDNQIRSMQVGPKNRSEAQEVETDIYLANDFPSLEECYARYSSVKDKISFSADSNRFKIDFKDSALNQLIESKQIKFNLNPLDAAFNEANTSTLKAANFENFFIVPLWNNSSDTFHGIIIGDNVYDNKKIGAFKRDLMQLMMKQITAMFIRKSKSVEEFKLKINEAVNELKVIYDSIEKHIDNNQNCENVKSLKEVKRALCSTMDYTKTIH